MPLRRTLLVAVRAAAAALPPKHCMLLSCSAQSCAAAATVAGAAQGRACFSSFAPSSVLWRAENRGRFNGGSVRLVRAPAATRLLHGGRTCSGDGEEQGDSAKQPSGASAPLHAVTSARLNSHGTNLDVVHVRGNAAAAELAFTLLLYRPPSLAMSPY
jgi:hypothetical protein